MKTVAGTLLIFQVTIGLADTIPLSDLSRWEQLTYNGIQPNTVTAQQDGLHITVRGSASPLIYRLDHPTVVTELQVVASWSGMITLPRMKTQGDEGADDFVLKLGLVEAGDQTLNWVQKRVAANWIKRLHGLAPAGTGINRIHFLTTTQNPAQLGSERIHPLSDLLYETRISLLKGTGIFEMNHEFPEPVEILGLWISADGDDTNSIFDLNIKQITLGGSGSPTE